MNPAIGRSATLLALAAVACAAPGRLPPGAVPTPSDDACALGGGRPASGDTVTIALSGSVDPSHVPNPTGDAERSLFRALYETLVRVDCDGRVWPALAAAWTAEEGGRRWTFVLRPDARFWDGEPVTAQDVVAAWAAHDTLASFAPWAGPVAQAAQVMSERVVAVTLRRPSRDVPRALAHPGLAVTKGAPGLRWPIGTGRYWLDEAAGGLTAAPAFGESLPVLRFRALRSGDARDALDAGADVVLSDDAATDGYARTRGDLEVRPLPWERTYALIAPDGAWPHVDRDALARDAVRADARAAGELPRDELACAGGAGPAVPRPRSPRPTGRARRIVYPRGDATARDLADRLVALAESTLVAAGLSRDAFAAELRSGAAAGYVISLARASLDFCGETEALRRRAPWLAIGAVVPLVDVRRRVVVRDAVGGLTVDWDGALRVR